MFYFNESMLEKMKALTAEHSVEPTTEQHSDAANLAKGIIEMMTPEDIVVENGVLKVGPNTTTSAPEKYDAKDLARVEEEIKHVLKAQLGVNANVSFSYAGHTDVEPDEPKYKGQKERLHLYSLCITAKV
ncbi:MAG: hypothetical protein IJO08_04320 [Clostridia bacterium]|nr:hypothetical protein [Clostridia bacterium]